MTLRRRILVSTLGLVSFGVMSIVIAAPAQAVSINLPDLTRGEGPTSPSGGPCDSADDDKFHQNHRGLIDNSQRPWIAGGASQSGTDGSCNLSEFFRHGPCAGSYEHGRPSALLGWHLGFRSSV